MSKLRGYLGTSPLYMGFAVGLIASSWNVSDKKDMIVAAGTVTSDPSLKVRAPEQGSIREILVGNGQNVAAGALVARLDDSAARLSLALVARQKDAMLLRSARLQAELIHATELPPPERIALKSEDPDFRAIVEVERRMFAARSQAHQRRIDLQRQRIDCFQEQLHAYEAQARAKAREIALIESELLGTRALREKKLVPITRLTELERDAVRLEGEEKGSLAASIADAKARIADTELQILQADEEHQREISRELGETQEQIAQIDKTRSIAEAALKQTEIRAAQGGIVRHELRTRVGETVYPGEEVMRIVPHVGGVSVEARISYADAVRLRVGQAAELQFASAGDNGSGSVRGTLARLRANSAPDAKGYALSYTAQVVVPPEEISRLGPSVTEAGSRATVEVESRGGCSALGCLVRPIGNVLARAYRTLKADV